MLRLFSVPAFGTDMESARVASVREAYDRFNNEDIAGLLDLLDEEIELPDVLHDAVLVGKPAVQEAFEEQFRLVHHSMLPSNVVEAGDTVVVAAFHQMYDRGGARLGAGVAAVHRFTFRGDRIVRVEFSALDDIPDAVRRRLG